jgi:ABC-type uncharacterized transport system involved in gliding motility auxiliary subunit
VALMKTDPRRFAPLGLVLSGLAVLTFIIFLVVRALALAGIFQPPDPLILERGMWVSFSIFILGIALTAFLDPDRTRQFLTGRQAQYGSNAAIMFLAFVGILFFVNLLAYQNPISWDITESQKNTLSPETITMLKALKSPVAARAYFSTRADSSQARKLLDNFKQDSSGNFTYTFIDPEANPVAAQQDGIDRDGSIVLQIGGQKEPVSQVDEQGLAVAIVRLMNPQQRMLYFITGHGEADTEQASDTSYSLIRRALENKNYTVKTLNIGSQAQIPQDAKVIIVAGPQSPLSSEEVKALQSYLDKGGSLVLMEDPASLTKIGNAPDPINAFLAGWGIKLQNDILVDPNANPPLLVYADPLNYAAHPITERLRGINSKFLTAQSILLETAPQEITLTALAKTYKEAWGETDLASINANQVSFDQTKDNPGPLVLAASAENAVTKGRLVVFGDSEFATDALYKVGNGDILLNAIDWASQQEILINITPRNNIARSFNPPGSLALIGTILASICFLPLIIIAAGVSAWYSRRRRG